MARSYLEQDSIDLMFGISEQTGWQKRPGHRTTPIGLIQANEAGDDAFGRTGKAAVRSIGRPHKRFVCPFTANFTEVDIDGQERTAVRLETSPSERWHSQPEG